ncbi:hypothetical protein [Shewanella sp. HN-41]|uniref:hypothetical protein n=1 Tax=Shewanella sp. HN-41 TaxID=327275 RepID=UPI0002125828|nr:hypothetical protein [Shewanella sp. HN-41]EGM68728.1 hypothetical protein SOHN41_03067 [Shewanella sp. HN-41]
MRLVERLGDEEGISVGQMFGKSCIKIYGNVFIAQYKDFVVFKLTGSSHAKVLAAMRAELWNPSGKGPPMKAFF